MATEISTSIERRAAEQSLLDRVNDIERNGMVLGVMYETLESIHAFLVAAMDGELAGDLQGPFEQMAANAGLLLAAARGEPTV